MKGNAIRMKLSLLVVLVVLPVALAHRGWGGGFDSKSYGGVMSGAGFKEEKRGWPFSWLPANTPSRLPGGRDPWGQGSTREVPEECRCTSRSISLSDKLRIIAQHNDHNGDGVVKFEDLQYDATERFDKDNDGVLTEGECVRSMACLYGDTEQVATFVCALIFEGAARGRVEEFNAPPFIEGVPIADFITNARSRYEKFYEFKCANKDLTIEEKLTRNAANNDHNNDSLVTMDDITYDLNNFYDLNKDGNVTNAEWVARWVCNYGDSGDYARYIWNDIVGNSTVIVINSFAPFNGSIPIESFKAGNRQRYERFKLSSLERYIRKNP